MERKDVLLCAAVFLSAFFSAGIQAQGRGGCRPLLCRNYCVNGRVQSGGCDTCACSPTAGSALSSGLAGRQVSSCQQRSLCRNFCFQGRATDSNGCQTCNCRSSSGATPNGRSISGRGGVQVRRPTLIRCRPVRCRSVCPGGRVSVDRTGCPTCQCERTYRFRG